MSKEQIALVWALFLVWYLYAYVTDGMTWKWWERWTKRRK